MPHPEGSVGLGRAHLAELVDALVLGTSGFGRGGSSPPVGILFSSLVADCFRWVESLPDVTEHRIHSADTNGPFGSP